LSLDAIARTLFRLAVSKKNLLEWVTFAQSAYGRRGSWRGLTLQLAGSFAFTGAVVACLAVLEPENLWTAGPLLLLWAVSPIVARWASAAPELEPHLDISESDTLA